MAKPFVVPNRTETGACEYCSAPEGLSLPVDYGSVSRRVFLCSSCALEVYSEEELLRLVEEARRRK